jgi:hypothetical protein
MRRGFLFGELMSGGGHGGILHKRASCFLLL